MLYKKIILLTIAFNTSSLFADTDTCKFEIYKCDFNSCENNLNSRISVSLNIQAESESNYDRNDYKYNFFGWEDDDNNCLNTRHEILKSKSLEPPVLSSNGCTVLMGLWHDPYTNRMIENPKEVDIDHIVPLKEAHQSGAHAWDKTLKVEFTNDFYKSRNLIPVWNSINRSKGPLEPHQWLPPNSDFHCEYINRWVYTKWTWGLSMDNNECHFTQDIIKKCEQQLQN